MNRFYPDVAERAAHRCEYCRAPERVFNFAFEVEHIQPRAAGGSDQADNLALACESCNLYKSDAVEGIDPATAERTLLYHPRQNSWVEHFAFDPETAEISGRTATGRATIARLKLNSAFQIRARQHWARLDLYP